MRSQSLCAQTGILRSRISPRPWSRPARLHGKFFDSSNQYGLLHAATSPDWAALIDAGTMSFLTWIAGFGPPSAMSGRFPYTRSAPGVLRFGAHR